MSQVGFQMWEPLRQKLMAEHRFYVEQAHKRLLSQFENIDAEASEARDSCLNEIPEFYDPDIHDPLDSQEAAFDKGYELYDLLSGMRGNTCLSVVAGMFHEWDKQHRNWLVREIRQRYRWEGLINLIWNASFDQMMGFLAAFGFDCRKSNYFQQLNAMRLVVNVFKHGDGKAFESLKSSFPEFLGEAQGVKPLLNFYDYTDVRVTEEQLGQFSQAILDFWSDVPKQLFRSYAVKLPQYFEEKLLKGEWVAVKPPSQVGRRKK